MIVKTLLLVPKKIINLTTFHYCYVEKHVPILSQNEYCNLHAFYCYCRISISVMIYTIFIDPNRMSASLSNNLWFFLLCFLGNCGYPSPPPSIPVGTLSIPLFLTFFDEWIESSRPNRGKTCAFKLKAPKWLKIRIKNRTHRLNLMRHQHLDLIRNSNA